jgi:hypothetical protein
MLHGNAGKVGKYAVLLILPVKVEVTEPDKVAQ